MTKLELLKEWPLSTAYYNVYSHQRTILHLVVPYPNSYAAKCLKTFSSMEKLAQGYFVPHKKE